MFVIKNDVDKKTLVSFCWQFAVALIVFSQISKKFFMIDVSMYFLFLALLFLLAGILKPSFIRGFYFYWLALTKSVINILNYILLFLVYFLCITPYSVIVRLFMGDLLQRKIEKNKNSYWEIKKEKQFIGKNYLRQF